MDGHLKYGLLMGLYSSALLAMPTTVLANTDTQNATDLPQIVSWDGGPSFYFLFVYHFNLSSIRYLELSCKISPQSFTDFPEFPHLL